MKQNFFPFDNTMDRLAVVFLIISFSWPSHSASVFRELRTWDCGSSDKVVNFRDATVSPTPVVYPGNVSLGIVMELLEDLPSENLKVKVQVEKLEPERMQVPCMNGMGSW
jgi:hypothetical protein